VFFMGAAVMALAFVLALRLRIAAPRPVEPVATASR
jgi:hypothetical protein